MSYRFIAEKLESRSKIAPVMARADALLRQACACRDSSHGEK